jgi:hypothetical protein
MKIYKIWTGSGDNIDGATFPSKSAAERAVRRHYGWVRLFRAVYGDGEAYCVYPSARERDEDRDGAYAVTIT